MNKWLFLLRSFFPKWIFFDDVAPELRLEVSYGKSENHLGPWINALTPIRRSIKNLALNSHGNYLHACHNHLNHFNSDLSSIPEVRIDTVPELTTYKITKDMASFQIEDRGLESPPYFFRFRLAAVGVDIVLISPVYRIEC